MSDFYVGLDVLKTTYSTQEYYGRNIFAKNPTAWNAFVGYKLPRDFFIEMGYVETKNKKRTESSIEVRDMPGAFPLPPALGVNDTNTKIKIKLPYIGVGINYPLSFFNDTNISGLIGLSAVKLNACYSFINDPTFERNFSKRKISPIVRIGLNHAITNKFEVRLTSTWYKLTKFKLKSEEVPTTITEIQMKNGYTFGVGIVYNI